MGILEVCGKVITLILCLIFTTLFYKRLTPISLQIPLFTFALFLDKKLREKKNGGYGFFMGLSRGGSLFHFSSFVGLFSSFLVGTTFLKCANFVLAFIKTFLWSGFSWCNWIEWKDFLFISHFLFWVGFKSSFSYEVHWMNFICFFGLTGVCCMLLQSTTF